MASQEIRDRVLALQADRKPQPLDFEPWGEGIYMRVLSVDDQAKLAEATAQTEMPVQVILHCLVDETGERIFSDEDRAALGAFPFPEILQVFGQVAKLNGLSTEELDKALESFVQAPDEHRSTD